MKHVLSAIFLVVFGLAVSASADFQMSEAEIEALEKQMATSQLRNLTLTDDDFDDDDDEPDKRGWNPISWIKNQFRNKCVCQNVKCDCCFKLKLFKNKQACFSAERLPAAQQIQVSLKLDGKTLVYKRFDLKRSDSICGPVPVPALSFLKFCFSQRSSVEGNGAIRSCSSVEFKIGGATGATIRFQCLVLKGGKLTFGGRRNLEKSAMLDLEASDPFKAAVELNSLQLNTTLN